MNLRGRLREERGGVVVWHILKIAAGLGLLALVLFEAGHVVVAQIDAQSAARAGAEAASATWLRTKNQFAATEAAGQAADGVTAGVVVEDVRFATDGSWTVSVTVSNTADTVVAGRLSFLRRFTRQHATQDAAYIA